MVDIALLVHDIRSTHNVGSLLRTAECLGVEHVYFTGYTPYPHGPHDSRLPHIARKLQKDISKTALGADELISWSHEDDITSVISHLRGEGYSILALEQAKTSVPLSECTAPQKVALLIGREVEGISPDLLKLCDTVVEIPQFGQKESLNVVQATAIALYSLQTTSARE